MPEEYDRIRENQRLLASIQEGLDDIEAGRWIEDRALAAELAAELDWEE